MKNKKSKLYDSLFLSSRDDIASNVAICDISMTLDNSEVDKYSNKLANYLKTENLSKGDVVAILAEKSSYSIIAVFAIMKIGATFLILDKEDSNKRNSFKLNETKSKLLISDFKFRNNANDLVKDCKIKKLIINQESNCKDKIISDFSVNILKASKKPIKQSVYDDDVAYILYTSGSTGMPKGAMITYGSIYPLIAYTVNRFNLNTSDKILFTVPMMFDVSIWDIFISRLSGAELVIPITISVIPSLLKQIEEKKITYFYAVSTLLILFSDTFSNIDSYNLKSVKTIIFGASICPSSTIFSLMKNFSSASFYNCYGTVETSVAQTFYRVTNSDHHYNISLPIGASFEGVNYHILKENGKLAKKNEVGEIIIDGPNIMKGYVNQPTLTNSVIKDAPKKSGLKNKVYFTGDLARIDNHGQSIVIGRKDDQIKSGSKRIELDEIQLTVNNHENVLEVAVIAIPDPILENKIKALVVLKKNCQLKSNDIHNYCKASLPPYMVPHLIEIVKKIPKNRSGKIDRKLILQNTINSSESIFIETSRKKLRKVTPGEQYNGTKNNILSERLVYLTELDSSGLSEIYEYSKEPMFYRFMEYNCHQSKEDTNLYIKSLINKTKKVYPDFEAMYWYIRLIPSGKIIGTIGIVDIDYNRRIASFGSGISPKYWGKGYALEANQLLVKYFFEILKMDKLIAILNIDNKPSEGILKSLRFIKEGTLKNHLRKYDGTRQNAFLYGLLRSDYEKFEDKDHYVKLTQTMKKLSIKALGEIFNETFNIPANSIKKNLKMDNISEWDSMGHINLIISLESLTNLKFNGEEIAYMTSINKIIEIVNDRLEEYDAKNN